MIRFIWGEKCVWGFVYAHICVHYKNLGKNTQQTDNSGYLG